ncbi:5'-methylthioadenosine/S-adenosylhomocysteine nucleosidase family protein [Calditrichota bacterium GD2]
MLTVVSALRAETEPIIHAMPQVEALPCGAGSLRHYGHFDLLRVGVGEQRAVQSFKAYLGRYRPSQVVLTGFAGALNAQVSIGQVFAIEKIIHAGSSQTLALPIPETFGRLARASLLTVANALTDGGEKNKFRKKFKTDLVDMESFYLAALCYERGIDCIAVKAVSDLADSTANVQFKKNFKSVSLILFETLKSILQIEK